MNEEVSNPQKNNFVDVDYFTARKRESAVA